MMAEGTHVEPVSPHTAAKSAMTAAAVATLAGDPRAVELATAALQALRSTEESS